MSNEKAKSALSIAGIFMISVIWGLSFVFMKDAISEGSVLYVLAIRFLLAGVPMALIFMKRLVKAKKEDWLRGMIIGVILIVSYLFQGYGCKYTTASKNALLSSVYGVIVPFASWIIFKKKPKFINLVFAIIAFVGIGLITINGFESINIGDVLTLFGGIIFAFQISLMSEFSRKSDPMLLTTIQFLTVGIVLICFAPLEGGFPTYLFTDPDLLWRMLVLGFICTLLCFAVQSICQRHVQVVVSGVIISLEAPFGVIAGVLMRHDRITNLMIGGIVVLFVAVIGMQVFESLSDKITLRKKELVPVETKNKNSNEENVSAKAVEVDE